MLQDSELRRIAKYWPVLFVIFFVVYSFEINNFNISIDDERHAYFYDQRHGYMNQDFVPLGRWLFSIVQTFWPQLVVPQGPYIIFGIMISIFFCFVLRMIKVDQPTTFHYACFVAFITFPVLPTHLEFHAHLIPLGISFLASAMAVYYAFQAQHTQKPFGAIGLAIALGAVAIGAYQSAIANYIVLFAAILLYANLSDGRLDVASLRPAVLGTAVLIGSVVIYSIIAWLFIVLSNLPTSDYAQEQIGSYDGTSAIISGFYYLLQGVYRVYYAWWWEFGLTKYVFLAALICAVLVICWYAFRISRSSVLIAACIIIGILVAPAAFVLVSGRPLPVRTFIAAPTAFALVFMIAYRLSKKQWIRNGLTILVVFVAIQGLYVYSTQQARAWVRQNYDLALASSLNFDILRITRFQPGEEISIDFFGYRDVLSVYPVVPTAEIGSSFWGSYGGGHPIRKILFLNMIGLSQYKLAYLERPAEVLEVYEGMAVWPEPGSIQLFEGVVLVKLSE